MKCPDFGKPVRFSTSQYSEFYECLPANEFAILRKCGNDKYYSTAKEDCQPIRKETSESTRKRRSSKSSSKSSSSTSDKPKILNHNVLDQDVRLGDFYDVRSRQYLAGTSLWSTDVLNKVKQNNRNPISSYEYLYKNGRTTTERLDMMDIKASLKLDFLGEPLLRLLKSLSVS